jgi:multisubunit Na+/H+ antiporter MnhB subunit
VPGPVPAPKANTASTVDLVVTIALFVVIAMLSGFAVLFGWVLGTVSQYGCDWESSTRVCNRSMGMQTAVVEAIVLVVVCTAGGVLAAKVRRKRPLGWLVALGTAAAVAIALALTLAVVGAASGS